MLYPMFLLYFVLGVSAFVLQECVHRYIWAIFLKRKEKFVATFAFISFLIYFYSLWGDLHYTPNMLRLLYCLEIKQKVNTYTLFMWTCTTRLYALHMYIESKKQMNMATIWLCLFSDMSILVPAIHSHTAYIVCKLANRQSDVLRHPRLLYSYFYLSTKINRALTWRYSLKVVFLCLRYR